MDIYIGKKINCLDKKYCITRLQVSRSCAIQQNTLACYEQLIMNGLFSEFKKPKHRRTDYSTQEVNLILCWRLQNVVEEAPLEEPEEATGL